MIPYEKQIAQDSEFTFWDFLLCGTWNSDIYLRDYKWSNPVRVTYVFIDDFMDSSIVILCIIFLNLIFVSNLRKIVMMLFYV
jgi:hypothetical protein